MLHSNMFRISVYAQVTRRLSPGGPELRKTGVGARVSARPDERIALVPYRALLPGRHYCDGKKRVLPRCLWFDQCSPNRPGE